MDRFTAINAFVRVVETGSFARAAERLAISTSACSRYIAELETRLGARLLQRTTRRLSLTEAGQAFHDRSVALLADLEEAEQAASATAAHPRGTIKITASFYFGRLELAPAIAAFLERHPEVRFQTVLADRVIDLVEEGFDLAIRIGPTIAESAIARPLGETRMVVCAAPACLARHRALRHPRDLPEHECLRYDYESTGSLWRLFDAQGTPVDVRANGPVFANSGEMLVELALAGVGLTFAPEFMVADELASGRLVRALPDCAMPSLPIQAVYPSRRHLSAKVRMFVDFLAERFKPPARAGTPLAAAHGRPRGRPRARD